MVCDQQIKILRKYRNKGKSMEIAASKANMSAKTGYKYEKDGRLPSEMKQPRQYKTRKNPFDNYKDEIYGLLKQDSQLTATTIFEELCERYPDTFSIGQKRSLERLVRMWKNENGSEKSLYFDQEHPPGRVLQCDFTYMSSLGVTIDYQPFDHLVFQMVSPFSGKIYVEPCASESFESLSEGVQNGLAAFGGTPKSLQTDSLTAAVKNLSKSAKEFTKRYHELLDYYRIKPKRSNVGKPNENGSVERRNGVLKNKIDQALRLRGNRNFNTYQEYFIFIEHQVNKHNTKCQSKIEVEHEYLGQLPPQKIDTSKRVTAKVDKGGIVVIDQNRYSLPSRYAQTQITAYIKPKEIEVYLGTNRIETLPRLKGKNKAHINYRHIIDQLCRKPGAFENYRYREHLFPSHTFRLAFDQLAGTKKGVKEYLFLLQLAKNEGEELVEKAIRTVIEAEMDISFDVLKTILNQQGPNLYNPLEVSVDRPSLSIFDALLDATEKEEEKCKKQISKTN